MSFKFQGSVADGGTTLNQRWVFAMDSSDLLNATLDNWNNSCHSIEHKASTQCCFNVGPEIYM